MAYPAQTNNGAVTSWIPLTTQWPMTTSCSTIYRQDGQSLVAFDPAYGLDIDTAVDCEPSAVTTWWEQARLGVGGTGHTAVSIGPITCPQGWLTAATYVTSSSTQVMCCPSEYSLANAFAGTTVNGNCESAVSSAAVLTYETTPGGQSTSWSRATITLTKTSTIGAIAVVGWNLGPTTSSAPMISSSRMMTSTIAPTSSTSSASLTTSSTSSSTSSTTSDNASSTSATVVPLAAASDPSAITGTPASSGMSAGTISGICVGISAVLLLVAFALRRHRRARPAIGGPFGGPPRDNFYPPPAELPGRQEKQGVYEFHEMPGDREAGELYASSKMGNASTVRSPVEMEGHPVQYKRGPAMSWRQQ